MPMPDCGGVVQEVKVAMIWNSRSGGVRGAILGAAAATLLVTSAAVAADPAASTPAPEVASTPAPEVASTPAPEVAPTPTPGPNLPSPDVLLAYHSRPDLHAPRLTIEATDTAGDDPLFITGRYGDSAEGLMIYDATGELVWLHRAPGRSALGVRPVTYAGEPALAWWEGVIDRGLGDGEFVLMDDSYREIARLRTGRHPADLHEFRIAPDGTAYVFALDRVEIDGQLIDDYLVEQRDIGTGRLLWRWRASDHIPLAESVHELPDDGPWDYLHLNSVDLDGNGDLILSARHTDTVYKVSRATGEVVWRLGGASSDFALPEEAVFRKQHDARWHDDGTISLFDNATADNDDPTQPRGLVFRLHKDAGTAELVRELAPPRATNSSSQGNFTINGDGSATIGWGSSNLVTGYGADDTVVYDVSMPPGFSSYRSFRLPWSAQPLDDPIVAVGQDGDRTVAWVSWNGATDVAAWQLLGGPDADTPSDLGTTVRTGFETAVTLPADAAVVVLQALDGDGQVLGASVPLTVAGALAEPRPAD